MATRRHQRPGIRAIRHAASSTDVETLEPAPEAPVRDARGRFVRKEVIDGEGPGQ
jgi:hypothetical protein